MRTVDPDKHRAKRRHIIGAAVPLFATKGLDGTTTAEICAAAGMSSGNVFHYFSSKRDIFQAVFIEYDDVDEQVTAALAADDPFEALLGFVDHLAAPAGLPNVPTLVLEAMLQATRDPDLAATLERQARDEDAALATLVARCVEADQVDPGLDVEHAASWISTLVGALFLRAATTEGFDPAIELTTLRRIVARFLRGARS